MIKNDLKLAYSKYNSLANKHVVSKPNSNDNGGEKNYYNDDDYYKDTKKPEIFYKTEIYQKSRAAPPE